MDPKKPHIIQLDYINQLCEAVLSQMKQIPEAEQVPAEEIKFENRNQQFENLWKWRNPAPGADGSVGS
ncbi:MAG TPA: hypothetical protein VFY13_04625 [Luteolibacter sp.]|nr:hypothetical protein [Luteolibacter sp.]